MKEDIDFKALMPDVARHLLGEPSADRKHHRELRFGTRGSLSIDLDKGTWHDHETGIGGGVLDLIERETKRANGEAVAWLREHRFIADDKPEPAAQPRIVATYDYRDANGALLFQVVRMVPKTFRQRRPDGDGGWTWKLGDAPRVLYRLPELMQATPAATVFITEGEKDADALADRLLVATTNPGGAGKWRQQFNDHLRGRHVVVLPDNDEAGERHAQQIAHHLHNVAASVRILDLPDLPPKGDVSDWLAAGGTAEELEHLAADAPPFDPAKAPVASTEPAAAALHLTDPTALDGLPVPLRRWIVDEWLPVGHATANYGDGGTGKTLLAQQLQTACATGTPWCGINVSRCRTLGFYCEDDDGELHRRQAAILDHLGLDFRALSDMRWISRVGQDNALIRFDRDGTPELTGLFHQLCSAAIAFGARLVVIDTAADTFGGNENDRGQVRAFIGYALNRLAAAIDGAVLLNAHPSRTGMSATGDLDGGSTAWSNSVRSRWSLSRLKDEDGAVQDPDLRILTRRKANYAGIGEDIRLRWQRGVLVPERGPSRLDTAAKQQSAEAVFLALLDECNATNRRVSSSPNAGNYAPKIMLSNPKAAGITRKQLAVAMATLFSAGAIRNVEYGRRGDERFAVVRADPTDRECE